MLGVKLKNEMLGKKIQRAVFIVDFQVFPYPWSTMRPEEWRLE